MGDKTKTPAKRGKFMTGAIYLISPRFLASKELIARHGAFSTRYHKELISEIKTSIKALKEAKNDKPLIPVNDKAKRLEIFYDYLYESAVDQTKLSEMHRTFRSRGNWMLAMSCIVMIIAIIGLNTDFNLLIPNYLLSLFTFLYGLTVVFKSREQHFFAWLIEQRLTSQSVTIFEYLKKYPPAWPSRDLPSAMHAEIKQEYAIRDKLIKEAIADPNFDPEAYGLNVSNLKGAKINE